MIRTRARVPNTLTSGKVAILVKAALWFQRVVVVDFTATPLFRSSAAVSKLKVYKALGQMCKPRALGTPPWVCLGISIPVSFRCC